MNTKTKAAKATTKKASAKKLAPITVRLNSGKTTIPTYALFWLPMRQLAELLRQRGLSIPKSKDDMIRRLAEHFDANASPITITIHG